MRQIRMGGSLYFMWKNYTQDKVLTATIDFHRFSGFAIEGHPGESKATLTVEPGKTKSLLVYQVDFKGEIDFKCAHVVEELGPGKEASLNRDLPLEHATE